MPEFECTLVVARRAEVARDVVLLDLVAADGSALPAWAPGAHVDLLLGPDLVRQYSLCGDPADRARWQVAVLREPGGRGGSAFVHDRLAEGDRVAIRGPRNHFAFAPGRAVVFIAGGVGITPLVPMVAAASAAGVDWRLYYGGRSRDTMAFADDLAAAHADRVTIHPQDEYGLLDLDAAIGTPRAGTSVYCCGPEPLLRAVEARCASWPAGSLHVERFTPRPVDAPARAGSFEVELSVTGTTVVVPPDRSILDVLEEAGVPVYSSCQEGTCGTCETVVVDGIPDHRDSVLSDEDRAANETMMICVSRSVGPRLVLEL
ncbi:PDR/VanB family oxidoreductase [Phytohabitans suffuscus]|uniref:Ferredoxin n=1 Tax=Phytohabitans suffuscus TaxID=624315 RepID=A0A6F8YUY4_9ACTN|nr:PDR/VanB family oxidoreductase [Phytohabitans suffuscus]BCB89866.1 ferredoxin [Phytohabitans suffuscus]